MPPKARRHKQTNAPRFDARTPLSRLAGVDLTTLTAHTLARLVSRRLQHGSAYVQQGLEAYEAPYRAREVTTMAKQAKALG